MVCTRGRTRPEDAVRYKLVASEGSFGLGILVLDSSIGNEAWNLNRKPRAHLRAIHSTAQKCLS